MGFAMNPVRVFNFCYVGQPHGLLASLTVRTAFLTGRLFLLWQRNNIEQSRILMARLAPQKP